MNTNKYPSFRLNSYIDAWQVRKIGEFLEESRVSGSNGLKAKKLTVKLWGKGVVPKVESYSGSESTKYYKRSAGQFIYGKLDFLNQAFGIIPEHLEGYESTIDSPAFDISNLIDPNFLLKYVSRKEFYILQGTMANGSRKAKRIQSETFFEMSISIPGLKEQSEIGLFFKKIDYTITLHQQELEVLKQTKQGFLQKMFPEDGEAIPKFRFKEFMKDWNEEILANIADFSKGSGYSKGDLITEGTPILLYGQLYTNYKSIISSVSNYVSEKEKSVISAGNEVVVPASGESSEDIARASAITVPGIIIGGDLNIIRPTNKIEPIFLALVLSNGKVQRELSKFAQGKSVVHLQNSEIKKVRLTFPEIEEQVKIGEFFKQLDEVIELKEKELKALKQTKKGFLQKMFV